MDHRHRSSGFGIPGTLTDDTGTFWFFNADNLEMLIKVLDACPIGNATGCSPAG